MWHACLHAHPLPRVVEAVRELDQYGECTASLRVPVRLGYAEYARDVPGQFLGIAHEPRMFTDG
jgi:hypothetical protein